MRKRGKSFEAVLGVSFRLDNDKLMIIYSCKALSLTSCMFLQQLSKADKAAES